MTEDKNSVWQEWSSILPSIDLNIWSSKDHIVGDIVGRLITDDVHSAAFKNNFQRCAFRNCSINSCRWREVDFKDCAFTSTVFFDCDLSGGSTVSCTFSKCRFVDCDFTGAAFHECIYNDCLFERCKFQTSMIRNSRLSRCSFSSCETSNKLFDGCLLFDNIFNETRLDFRSIIDNFGLTIQQISSILIRNDRSYPGSTQHEFHDSVYEYKELNPFEIFRLSFYLGGSEFSDGAILDSVFDPKSWTFMVRAPVNFSRLLQDFADFILFLYDGSSCPSLLVLKLSILSDEIWSTFAEKYEDAHLAQTAAGIHLQCLQRLDLLEQVSQLIASNGGNRIVYRSFDDADDEQIAAVANDLSKKLKDASVSIRPRNSPVDIVFTIGNSVTLLLGIYIFLNTRTRFQLQKIGKQPLAEEIGTIVNFEIGGAQKEEMKSLLVISGSVPKVAHFRFDINFSGAMLKRLKDVIQDVRLEK
ncbi:pentapeptide repeat-containing protein [Pleomorphomonas sp. NRK KF1]|uniref:pentapeptide repeat-containing protein n=1 Tax=Pleomorphomonas sp. NRK KF1 TaxID=2943000 RepID=UPI002043665F|nr:pentapeptide repeat-containing protein [Pleomorphomonas sp. NRK KF1]MCM5554142.1 pentapeptide repeat-containing protein [Pleomorphomonas sp. NRK KF1]